MKRLSTGQLSTLGNWRKLCVLTMGADSPATKFLDNKIQEQGEDEEVIADESQFLYVLATLHAGPAEDPKPIPVVPPEEVDIGRPPVEEKARDEEE